MRATAWLDTFTEDECRQIQAALAARLGRPITNAEAAAELDRCVAEVERRRREQAERATVLSARDAGGDA